MMDRYIFTKVNDIIKKGKISPRVRFALQDVVDLRENKWVPRQRQDSQVKTTDQIHREAHDEEQLTRPQQSRPDLEHITVMKRGREEISSGLTAVTKKEEGMVLSKEVEGILQINTCK